MQEINWQHYKQQQKTSKQDMLHGLQNTPKNIVCMQRLNEDTKGYSHRLIINKERRHCM